MFRYAASLCCFVICFTVSPLWAQNTPQKDTVRSIPPEGIELEQKSREQLQQQLAELDRKIERLEKQSKSAMQRFLPDVQIFSVAVHRALEANTFYNKNDISHAQELLKIGSERADQLAQRKHPWTTQAGLVVRGYRSRLDGSVQPYGLVIGPDVKFSGNAKSRCDIWFHGRGEKSLELQFIHSRLHDKGQYELAGGIVLHPFGRYCNANRFAGEVDVFEALEDVKKNYKIDDDRIAVRGFSMGGASTWGFTVHYPCKWFASNPGAGFSDTLRFQKLDKNPGALPPAYERQLWTLYDADILADNLFDVPTIAYSGEIDGQRQAAEIMVAAAAKRGLDIPHIIGPDTAHKIHPDSKKIIEEMMDKLAVDGRPKIRRTVRFCTYTLKYNHCAWVTINGLGEHWAESYVDGFATGPEHQANQLALKTRNVDDFTVDFESGHSPFAANQPIALSIDGQNLPELKTAEQGQVTARFQKSSEGWQPVSTTVKPKTLVKRHNLQGPIDDALMEPFVFVLPTGEFINPQVKSWVQEESQRAITEWRRQMRGDVIVRKDTEVTKEDLANRNLILWGCPQSNAIIGKIAGDLPIRWSKSELTAGSRKFDPAHQAPILIYPNPLNPERYIVLNSGFTFREADQLNNSRQTPKLPDWAIIDFVEPADAYVPGKIVAAEFFDERWQLKQP